VIVNREGTFHVQTIQGRPRLVVTADGAGFVSHAGSALLGGLAERVGLTGWVDEELAVLGGVRRRGGGHRPGRVLGDLAVMIADGGEAIADIAVLGDQPALHGKVASRATCWRVLKAVADREQAGLDALARGRARARERAWLARAELTGAAVPPARAAGVDLDYLVIDLDATIVVCHSEKEQARACQMVCVRTCGLTLGCCPQQMGARDDHDRAGGAGGGRGVWAGAGVGAAAA